MRHIDDDWLDLASDALRDFSPAIDWELVGRMLADQLRMQVAGDFAWAPRVPGEVSAYTPGIAYDLPSVAARASDLHPLARHYARTRTAQPLAIHQVPAPQTPAERAYVAELAELGIEQHLWIPLPPDGRGMHVCGGCRALDPFTEQEIDQASAVQRVLSAIVVHAMVVQQWRARLRSAALVTEPRTVPDAAASTVALTPRELAVLELCAHGLTSQAMAHRLTISPRTVEKHLESVYRKLGVRERVSAVQRAQAMGVIGPAWLHPGPAGGARGGGRQAGT